MEILFNTDNNVEGKQALEDYMSEIIQSGLSRFENHITRIEVHVSDENGNKKGPNDKRCLIECRLKGLEPAVVTSQEDNIRKAVVSSLDKMKAKLTTITSKLKEH